MNYGNRINVYFQSSLTHYVSGIFSNGIAFLYADVLMLNKEFSFSSEDAEKDWTRFLLGAYVVDNRLFA